MLTVDRIFSSLQQMLIDLSLTDRSHYLANANQYENDIEHSMTVAMLCWYIHDRIRLN